MKHRSIALPICFIQKFFAIPLLLISFVMQAYDFKLDGFHYDFNPENDKVVSVVGHDYILISESGSLTIPEHVTYNSRTYTVDCIGDSAFKDLRNLDRMTIPKSIKTIGAMSFFRSGLSFVTIGDSVTSIGDRAFNYTDLRKVSIPSSVKTIGAEAFWCCFKLENVVIGESVTNIGYRAFANCKLSEIVIPDSVISIGWSAFNGSLVSVTIGKSVKEIGAFAFSSSKLSKISVDKGNKYFRVVDNILYSKDMSEIICFSPYRKISFTIPDSVTRIVDGAFSDCFELKSVTINNNVSDIEERGFNNCPHLETMYCNRRYPPEHPVGTYKNNYYKYCVLYVPEGCRSNYESTLPWSNFKDIIEMDFSGAEKVSVDNAGFEIVVSDGVIHINGADTDTWVEIYSTTGTCLYSGKNMSITGLPKGVYIVRVGNKNQKVMI